MNMLKHYLLLSAILCAGFASAAELPTQIEQPSEPQSSSAATDIAALKPEVETKAKPSTNAREEFEKAKKRYKDAVERILKAEGTSLAGDIGREMVAVISSIVLVKVYLKVAARLGIPGYNLTVFGQMAGRSCLGATLLSNAVQLLIRSSFDRGVRKTCVVDKELDLLISSKDLNLRALLAADINPVEIEAKIRQLSNKCEWARWIYRAIIGYSIISDALGELSIPGQSAKVVSALTFAILIPLYFYTVVMQSATWKRSSRLKKLEKLNALVEQAKDMMIKAKAARLAKKAAAEVCSAE